MNLKEKRIAPRHELKFIVDIYQNGKNFLRNNSIINISTTGCLIKLASELKVNVTEVISLHMEEKFIKDKFNFELDIIEAEIIRFTDEGKREVALRFLSLSQKDEKIINYLAAHGFILKEFPAAWQVSR